MLAELIQQDSKDHNIGLYAASLTRRASFDSVARLSVLPEPLSASMIEFHDIPRFSMFIIVTLRFVSSGRVAATSTRVLESHPALTPRGLGTRRYWRCVSGRGYGALQDHRYRESHPALTAGVFALDNNWDCVSGRPFDARDSPAVCATVPSFSVMRAAEEQLRRQ
jgi:hypothetical protein